LGRVCALPGRSRLTLFHASLGRASREATRRGERIRRVMKRTPRASSSPRISWVVSLESNTTREGSDPVVAFQWSQKAITCRAWLAFRTSALA
jgi:hypothetical protein